MSNRLSNRDAAGRFQGDARTAALIAGETTYLGSPCRHGHSGWRYVSTRNCVSCACAQARAREARRRGQKGLGTFDSRLDDPLWMNGYLAAWAPEEFERRGWRRAAASRYEEG